MLIYLWSPASTYAGRGSFRIKVRRDIKIVIFYLPHSHSFSSFSRVNITIYRANKQQDQRANKCLPFQVGNFQLVWECVFVWSHNPSIQIELEKCCREIWYCFFRDAFMSGCIRDEAVAVPLQPPLELAPLLASWRHWKSSCLLNIHLIRNQKLTYLIPFCSRVLCGCTNTHASVRNIICKIMTIKQQWPKMRTIMSSLSCSQVFARFFSYGCGGMVYTIASILLFARAVVPRNAPKLLMICVLIWIILWSCARDLLLHTRFSKIEKPLKDDDHYGELRVPPELNLYHL